MRLKLGIVVTGLMLSSMALAHNRQADPCGCHSQFGLRHCHTKKKTSQCEAPVKGKKAATNDKARPAKVSL